MATALSEVMSDPDGSAFVRLRKKASSSSKCTSKFILAWVPILKIVPSFIIVPPVQGLAHQLYDSVVPVAVIEVTSKTLSRFNGQVCIQPKTCSLCVSMIVYS